jgi:BASS family bile acid:Na+ symporter
MSTTNPLDFIRLNFSQGDLLFLNLALALIMYGVALDLSWDDFRYLIKNPKGFILGIFTHKKFPRFADKAAKILKPLSILIFSAFVGLAFAGNFNIFIQYIGMIFLWVFVHNFIALSAGFLTGKLGGLPLADVKTLTIETGIQNSGLGLVLIFTYFEGLGGMAIITALWGIWHLISGMTIASLWKLHK